MVQVDTDKNPKLAQRFNIHRHPTILLFRDRKVGRRGPLHEPAQEDLSSRSRLKAQACR
jgi:hypothetical protein